MEERKASVRLGWLDMLGREGEGDLPLSLSLETRFFGSVGRGGNSRLMTRGCGSSAITKEPAVYVV